MKKEPQRGEMEETESQRGDRKRQREVEETETARRESEGEGKRDSPREGLIYCPEERERFNILPGGRGKARRSEGTGAGRDHAEEESAWPRRKGKKVLCSRNCRRPGAKEKGEDPEGEGKAREG